MLWPFPSCAPHVKVLTTLMTAVQTNTWRRVPKGTLANHLPFNIVVTKELQDILDNQSCMKEDVDHKIIYPHYQYVWVIRESQFRGWVGNKSGHTEWISIYQGPHGFGGPSANNSQIFTCDSLQHHLSTFDCNKHCTTTLIISLYSTYCKV